MHIEHAAQIHHIEHFQAEVAQVVVHLRPEFRRRLRRQPGSVVAAPGADLGHDRETVAVGMQRLANDLVGDVRTTEIAGVDVVDAQFDRLAQQRDSGGAVLGRPEDTGAGQLLCSQRAAMPASAMRNGWSRT